jgi:hypothetical protein
MHTYGIYGKIPTSKSIAAKQIIFYRHRNYFSLGFVFNASKNV